MAYIVVCIKGKKVKLMYHQR